jgi:hypothetical protein
MTTIDSADPPTITCRLFQSTDQESQLAAVCVYRKWIEKMR